MQVLLGGLLGVAGGGSPFLLVALVLARLVDGRPLSDALVVATPGDDGVSGEVQNALDGFAAAVSPCCCGWNCNQTYRILMLRPPSFLVQILKTSSPLLTLSTKPHTSSVASMNSPPTIAMSNSSQYRSATPFFSRMIHLPPRLFSSSSHTGRMPSLKK